MRRTCRAAPPQSCRSVGVRIRPEPASALLILAAPGISLALLLEAVAQCLGQTDAGLGELLPGRRQELGLVIGADLVEGDLATALLLAPGGGKRVFAGGAVGRKGVDHRLGDLVGF